MAEVDTSDVRVKADIAYLRDSGAARDANAADLLEALLARATAAEKERDKAILNLDSSKRLGNWLADQVEDARSARDTALARVAALEAEVAWRPIESAPKDGTDVLVTKSGEGFLARIARWIDPSLRWPAENDSPSSWRMDGSTPKHTRSVTPTHWRPLPTPPKDKSDG